MNATAAFFAILVTIYFWWENIKGIHESSEKALRIMQVTTVMGVMMIAWCAVTIYIRGAHMPPRRSADRERFELSIPRKRYAGFRDRCLQPLGHLSNRAGKASQAKNGGQRAIKRQARQRSSALTARPETPRGTPPCSPGDAP